MLSSAACNTVFEPDWLQHRVGHWHTQVRARLPSGAGKVTRARARGNFLTAVRVRHFTWPRPADSQHLCLAGLRRIARRPARQHVRLAIRALAVGDEPADGGT